VDERKLIYEKHFRDVGYHHHASEKTDSSVIKNYILPAAIIGFYSPWYTSGYYRIISDPTGYKRILSDTGYCLILPHTNEYYRIRMQLDATGKWYFLLPDTISIRCYQYQILPATPYYWILRYSLILSDTNSYYVSYRKPPHTSGFFRILPDTSGNSVYQCIFSRQVSAPTSALPEEENRPTFRLQMWKVVISHQLITADVSCF
jgi:hypothetical protein